MTQYSGTSPNLDTLQRKRPCFLPQLKKTTTMKPFTGWPKKPGFVLRMRWSKKYGVGGTSMVIHLWNSQNRNPCNGNMKPYSSIHTIPQYGYIIQCLNPIYIYIIYTHYIYIYIIYTLYILYTHYIYICTLYTYIYLYILYIYIIYTCVCVYDIYIYNVHHSIPWFKHLITPITAVSMGLIPSDPAPTTVFNPEKKARVGLHFSRWCALDLGEDSSCTLQWSEKKGSAWVNWRSKRLNGSTILHC